MNDKELDKSIKKSFENFIKKLADNPEEVFDNNALQVKYNNVLKEKIKLQSNWNSLKECIIGVIDGAGEELNTIRQGDDLEYINKCTLQYEAIRKNLEIVLDKMNELEGKENERI